MTRQEIYNRIRLLGSRDAYVLAEMKRLGFWNTESDMPQIPTRLIEQEATLNRELNELLDAQRRFQNRQALLKEMRRARMAEAKKRRQETKRRNEVQRQERAAAWTALQQQQIVYLGEGVSGGLRPESADADRLATLGLPLLETPPALAQAMNMTLGRLRFLAYNRPVSTVSHYQRFQLTKKSGGKRLISAPMPLLKNAQYWIYENILARVQPTANAHGFVPGRSILTNAQPHLGQEVVVNLDLKDFFPTITYRRVKGLFRKLGYGEPIATLLALLCTEADTDAVELDGQTYYVTRGERRLPQGAPTSPALTNLIGYRLDRRLQGLAQKLGFSFTRYADDLTFSASGPAADQVNSLLGAIRQIIDSEGFTLHPDKLQIMRRGRQQKVTGIVVNDQPGVDRQTLRRFRALLHSIGQSGWTGKSWGKGSLENSVLGYAQFVAMVKPAQGQALISQVHGLLGRPAVTDAGSLRPPEADQSMPDKPSADTSGTGKDWWDVL